ncbi:hypothetical protein E2C01_069222 [Portunus trituberculatus]|uniref:Uncharacterized protein n=1 Tax=Portunus trituberculatus TaxID=210409 RepID=A0A5B7HYB2_PORTR|nr:hypothetical protein [Portunus trituberculatus]
MVVHVMSVSEHGRAVVVALGMCSCLLALLPTLLLCAAPPPPPAPSILDHVLPTAAYPPVLAVRALLGGRRPVLLLQAVTSGAAAVVTGMALVVAGGRPAGRGAHRGLLGAARWALWGQAVVVAGGAVVWMVVGSWSGLLSMDEATQRWQALEAGHARDAALHAALEDVQFFLGCCGLGWSGDPAAWLLNHSAVPPSCCRPEAALPCLHHNLRALQAVRGAAWRRGLRRVLHLRSCPAEALRWLRDRAMHLVVVVVMAAAQHILVAGTALSALQNAVRNRDPLAPAPASALPNAFHHPLPLAQC